MYTPPALTKKITCTNMRIANKPVTGNYETTVRKGSVLTNNPGKQCSVSRIFKDKTMKRLASPKGCSSLRQIGMPANHFNF